MRYLIKYWDGKNIINDIMEDVISINSIKKNIKSIII